MQRTLASALTCLEWCLRSVRILTCSRITQSNSFSKWRLVFPSSSLCTQPRQFKVMLALQSEGSLASSHTTLPHLFVSDALFSLPVRSPLFLCFTLNNISCHSHARADSHTHTPFTVRAAFLLNAHTHFCSRLLS